MKPCDALLERLDAALAGTLDEALAAHLAGCPTCQATVTRARQLMEGSVVLGSVKAPRSLVARLKTLPRLAPPCEQAILVMDDAFAGELEDHGKTALLDHLDSCPRCRATWEASATLREVGRLTAPPRSLSLRLAVHPQRSARLGPQRRFFDLRLAVAAAYLLAAVSVLVAGNPATLARAGSEGLDRASLYARAAVTNRVQVWTDAAWAQGEAIHSWLRERGNQLVAAVHDLLGTKRANRAAVVTVVQDGNGG